MQHSEFVSLHGEEAWERLVKPLKEGEDLVRSNNANVIVHQDVIMPTLGLLGLSDASGLLEAKKRLERT